MFQYSLEEVAVGVGGRLEGDSARLVREVAIDSRSLVRGDGVLFVALRGARHDGHAYLRNVYERCGVRSFLVEVLPEDRDLMPEASYVLVEDTHCGLQALAGFHREHFSCPVVGITGSNGKTVVKEWLSELLAPSMRVHHSPRSFNSQVGVPLSLLGLGAVHEVGIYEVGISHPGEMVRLVDIVCPDVGIFTNLGRAHEANFLSLETKGREKLLLFSRARRLVLSADDGTLLGLASEELGARGVELLTWSTKGNPCLLPVELGEPHRDGRCPFSFVWDGVEHHGVLPSSDRASVANALHAFLTALVLGVPVAELLPRVEQLSTVPMRLEQRLTIHGKVLINDSYSCDLESLEVAMAFFAQQADLGHRAVILSDIPQSGMEPLELYGEVDRLLRRHSIDVVVGVGKGMAVLRSLRPDTLCYGTTEELLEHFPYAELAQASVLVKGARSFGLERASRLVEQQVHRTVYEVNLAAMERNLNYFRGLLSPGVKLFVLVKAFAYGHGLVDVAKLLAYHKVDYLGVAFADEGIALRKAGITLPIVVLNPSPDTYSILVDHGLEPEIFSRSGLMAFNEVARWMETSAYPVHLKFDTGMHRVGFVESEVGALLDSLDASHHVRVASMFTHLAAADEPSHDAFSRMQLAGFRSMADRVSSHLGYSPLRHALNSPGIERFGDSQFDMVRLGIGLHGISACSGVGLSPVASLKTYVAQVRELVDGDTVGYGQRGRIEGIRRVATLPIGYADGFSRVLGNGRGSVFIHGRLAPTIGNICMDTCMVDVTGLEVREGDMVEIFGTLLPVEQVAGWMDTIPYELMCSISARIPRVYFRE